MTSRAVPKEWGDLPEWVKEEWIHGHRDLPFYRPYMQRLVDHVANMAVVWKLLDSKRDAFALKGPLHSLLCLLHSCSLGLDPGSSRTRQDRVAIASDVQKHTVALIKQIDRLGNGPTFGGYPFIVAKSMDDAAWKMINTDVTAPFQEVLDDIESGAIDLDLSDAARVRLTGVIEALRNDLELQTRQRYSDPRPALRSLSDGVSAWAKDAEWNRSDKIFFLATELRRLLKGRHDDAVAILASVLLEEEVTSDAVKGVMKRRM